MQNEQTASKLAGKQINGQTDERIRVHTHICMLLMWTIKSWLWVFNAQPTGTVISRQYTHQGLLIIKNKTWLVKRIWLLTQLKWQCNNNNNNKPTHTYTTTTTLSLIFIFKSTGDSMLPWGTLFSCTWKSERVQPIFTRNKHSERKLLIKHGSPPQKPSSCRSRNMSCLQVVSYAFSR